MAGNLKGNISAKGQGFDGNPQNISKKGAPKTKLLKEVLAEELFSDYDKLSAIIRKLSEMALDGDLNAIKEVLDRYAGKSVQHNINEEVEKPIFKPIDLDVRSDDGSV